MKSKLVEQTLGVYNKRDGNRFYAACLFEQPARSIVLHEKSTII